MGTKSFIDANILRDQRDYERAHGNETERLRHQLGALGEQLAAAEARVELAERRLATLEKLRVANQLRCEDWAAAAYRLPPQNIMRESIERFADIMGEVVAQTEMAAQAEQGGGQQ